MSGSRAAAPAAAFEPGFVARLTTLFEETIAFNRVLGLRIVEISAQRIAGSIAIRPELIGHFTQQRLHGGVISAGLDTIGGLAILAAIAARHMDETPEQRLLRFAKLGTIDLRIDYLRPATGDRFELTAQVVRLGSRVATTQMQFTGAHGRLLATGTGAYIVA